MVDYVVCKAILTKIRHKYWIIILERQRLENWISQVILIRLFYRYVGGICILSVKNSSSSQRSAEFALLGSLSEIPCYSSKRSLGLFVRISFPALLTKIISSNLTTPTLSSIMCISNATTKPSETSELS